MEGGVPSDTDQTLALLLPLLILLTTLLFLLLVFLLFLLVVRRNAARGQIALLADGGPTNLELEDQLDHQLQLAEQRWLEQVPETTKIGYLRAKVWQTQYPPNSHPTDITLTQFLSIQEKGVSAWAFEPDYENNPALIVQGRTEITFLSDGMGMAPEEGGGSSVQSNLPLPRLNEVYYWECKMYTKPQSTTVAIGLATKPFPSFTLPGWNKYSVGYFSSDGFKSHSYPFTSTSYGPPLTEGDVLGVGYRPRTGTVFFTRNGKKLEDAFIGFNKFNLFPTVGANSDCSIHVNFGQAGFVFIEANVKKWGLAPMLGTLAPPPAYGSERGSILLESNGNGGSGSSNSTNTPSPSRQSTSSSTTARQSRSTTSSSTLAPPSLPTTAPTNARRPSNSPSTSFSASTSTPNAVSAASLLSSTAATVSSRPIKPSPLRHSRRISSEHSSASSFSSGPTNGRTGRSNDPERILRETEEGIGGSGEEEEDEEDDDARNPPTPGALDISLRSIHAFPRNPERDDEEEEQEEGNSESDAASESGSDSGEEGNEGVQGRLIPTTSPVQSRGAVLPPAYNPIDPHMYAPGVAEAVLEDAFSGVASRQFIPTIPIPSSSTINSPTSYHRPPTSSIYTSYPSSHNPLFPQPQFSSSRTAGDSSGVANGSGSGNGTPGSVSSYEARGDYDRNEGGGGWFSWARQGIARAIPSPGIRLPADDERDSAGDRV